MPIQMDIPFPTMDISQGARLQHHKLCTNSDFRLDAAGFRTAAIFKRAGTCPNAENKIKICTVESQVLTRVTNQKIRFLGVIDYIRNVVLLAFHIYLNAHHSTTSPPGISDLATGLMCIHKCRIKVTRKVHNSEKKEKKKRIPSSIYSWSIGHILEHEFFCLGLGCAGSKGKKWI